MSTETKHPLMLCGHAAQGTLSTIQGQETGLPVCVACWPKRESMIVDPAQPEGGRTAYCVYADRWTGKHDSGGRNGGRPVDGPVESSANLPFFEARPDEGRDRYYCGCWGWD